MTTTQLIEKEVTRLDEEQQVRVLEFARRLTKRPAGMNVQDLRQLAGSFTPADLAEIERAIEEDHFNNIRDLVTQSW